jgi:hypothetical protein
MMLGNYNLPNQIMAPMSVDQIQAAILQLSPADYAELIKRLADLDDDRWDRQLETDIAEGKLNFLAKEALADYTAGAYRSPRNAKIG